MFLLLLLSFFAGKKSVFYLQQSTVAQFEWESVKNFDVFLGERTLSRWRASGRAYARVMLSPTGERLVATGHKKCPVSPLKQQI